MLLQSSCAQQISLVVVGCLAKGLENPDSSHLFLEAFICQDRRHLVGATVPSCYLQPTPCPFPISFSSTVLGFVALVVVLTAVTLLIFIHLKSLVAAFPADLKEATTIAYSKNESRQETPNVSDGKL